MSFSTSSTPRSWLGQLWQSRVIQFLFALLCIGAPFVLCNIVVRFLPQGDGMMHLRNGIKIAVLVAAYLGYVHWVEKRAPVELSLKGAVQETGYGFLLGATLISLSVAMLIAFGAYQVLAINTDIPWSRYVAGFLAVAVLEELIFRVVLFRFIEQFLGSVIAIVLSTALFGLVHLTNPNATWINVAVLTLCSLVLVGAFLFTRRLWLCMGLHWSWNLFQVLFSISVSGRDAEGWVKGQVTGPAWLTGGSFGVEASVLTLLLSLFAASYLLYGAYKKGHVVSYSQ